MLSTIKKSACNVSMAASALLMGTQFGIVELVYKWTGWKMPRWLSVTCASLGTVSAIFGALKWFIPAMPKSLLIVIACCYAASK